MDIQFDNKLELINCINDLNNKYYKPADELFKLYEEYSRNNAALFLGDFRDAHFFLANVILDKDVISKKNVIKKHLENYIKKLQKIIAREYVALIIVRIVDLMKSPLTPPKKLEIKNELSPQWKKLKNQLPSLNDDKTNELLLDILEETYKFVESVYKKHHI